MYFTRSICLINHVLRQINVVEGIANQANQHELQTQNGDRLEISINKIDYISNVDGFNQNAGISNTMGLLVLMLVLLLGLLFLMRPSKSNTGGNTDKPSSSSGPSRDHDPNSL